LSKGSYPRLTTASRPISGFARRAFPMEPRRLRYARRRSISRHRLIGQGIANTVFGLILFSPGARPFLKVFTRQIKYGY
jgi:hypothetical protein